MHRILIAPLLVGCSLDVDPPPDAGPLSPVADARPTSASSPESLGFTKTAGCDPVLDTVKIDGDPANTDTLTCDWTIRLSGGAEWLGAPFGVGFDGASALYVGHAWRRLVGPNQAVPGRPTIARIFLDGDGAGVRWFHDAGASAHHLFVDRTGDVLYATTADTEDPSWWIARREASGVETQRVPPPWRGVPRAVVGDHTGDLVQVVTFDPSDVFQIERAGYGPHRRFDVASGSFAADARGALYRFASAPSAQGDLSITKYDQTLVHQWTHWFGAIPTLDYGLEYIAGLAVDETGGIYVSGATFGDIGGPNQGWGDTFTLALDATGQVRWSAGWGTAEYEWSDEVALIEPDHVLSLGQQTTPHYLTLGDLLIDRDRSGHLRWVRQLSNTKQFAYRKIVPRSGGAFLFLYGDGEALNIASMRIH